jgi:hypothetical protein
MHVRAAPPPVSAFAWLWLCALLHACAYDWQLLDAGGAAALGGDGEREDVGLGATEAQDDAAPPRSEPRDAEADAGLPEDEDAPATDARVGAIDGGEPSTAPDAAAPAQDATADGPASTSLDAQLPDAAGPDAAAGARLCARLDAAFCDDFEQSSIEAFSWQEVSFGSQASVTLVDGGAAPGGFALRSALGGTPDESARAVVRLLAAAPSWFRASFDFLPSLSFAPEGDELIFWFRLTEQSGDAYRGVFVGTGRDGTFLIVQNFDGVTETWDMHPVAALPAGWAHVELELRLGPDGSAELRFNGAGAASLRGPIYVTGVEQSFVQVGLYSQPGTRSSALYDNLVLEFLP